MGLDWLIAEFRAARLRVTYLFLLCWLVYMVCLSVGAFAAGYFYGQGSALRAGLIGLAGMALAAAPLLPLWRLSRPKVR